MTVQRAEPATVIRWQCNVCDDAGVISNWEDSPFDLRRHGLTFAGAGQLIVVSDEVAAALRELPLLDTDSARRVFGMRAHPDGAVLVAGDDDLEELIRSLAAEANHEPHRPRRQVLDAAFDALTAAAQTAHRC